MAESQSNAPLRAPAGAPTSGVIHVRTRLAADFTVIANALVQRRGSAVTVGVAAYILSLPDGAPVRIDALCEHFTEGEILISRALRELEADGYLERRRERDLGGVLRTRTFFYDVPRGEEPEPPVPPSPPRPRRSGPSPRKPEGTALCRGQAHAKRITAALEAVHSEADLRSKLTALGYPESIVEVYKTGGSLGFTFSVPEAGPCITGMLTSPVKVEAHGHHMEGGCMEPKGGH